MQRYPDPLRTIRSKAVFRALRQSPHRARSRGVSIVFLPSLNGSGELSSVENFVGVAFSLSKKVGNAVERNRLKRRMKAILSRCGKRMAPGMYLFGAGAEAKALTHAQLNESIQSAIEKVGRGAA